MINHDEWRSYGRVEDDWRTTNFNVPLGHALNPSRTTLVLAVTTANYFLCVLSYWCWREMTETSNTNAFKELLFDEKSVVIMLHSWTPWENQNLPHPQNSVKIQTINQLAYSPNKTDFRSRKSPRSGHFFLYSFAGSLNFCAGPANCTIETNADNIGPRASPGIVHAASRWSAEHYATLILSHLPPATASF